jgi:hypothetical protein
MVLCRRFSDAHRPDLEQQAAGVHTAFRDSGNLHVGRCGEPPRAGGRRRRRCSVRSTWKIRLNFRKASIFRAICEAKSCSFRASVSSAAGGPLANALIDVWQSDTDGFYDVQRADLNEPTLRGRFRADSRGRLYFRSIRPSAYPIPNDGPVGPMLAATARHP